MRELVVATISDQPDIEIVGVLEDEASILGTVEQSVPDVLVVALDRSEDRPYICDNTPGTISLYAHPRSGRGAQQHNVLLGQP